MALLKREAFERDAKHVGIRIDSELGPDNVLVSRTMFSIEDLRKVLDTKITVSLRDFPLIEGIRAVTALSGCSFIFTPEGVELAPYPMITDSMETRTLALPTAIFGKSAAPEEFGVSRSEIQAMRQDLKQYLIDRGVQFSAKASCTFDANGMTMVIINTIKQRDLAQAILATCSSEKTY